MSDRHPPPRKLDSNSMFATLVVGDADVVGLLAYSIYRQCKDEWRAEFNKDFGREPNAHEMAVYELGEQTPRRKITYRFLADARLTGAYTDVSRSSANHSFIQKIYEHQARAAISRHPLLMGSLAPGGKVGSILVAFALGLGLSLMTHLFY